jgi:hypothetical protein
MYCHQECSKREVTIYLKREGTIHRGHRLHSVSLLGCVCVCPIVFYFHFLLFIFQWCCFSCANYYCLLFRLVGMLCFTTRFLV